MKKEEAKKVEFGGVSKMKVEFKAPTKPTEDVSKQTTQIDEIMMSEASTGNQKIVLVNMITETIKSKKVVLEYDEENKTTGVIKKICLYFYVFNSFRIGTITKRRSKSTRD